jgi:hypothetical protein
MNGVVNIAVLHAEDRQFGLVVDGVEDTQEIPPGARPERSELLRRATIMGDGGGAHSGRARIAQCGESPPGGSTAPRRRRGGNATSQALLLFAPVPSSGWRALSLVARRECPLARSNARATAGGQHRGRILPLAPLAAILIRLRVRRFRQDPVRPSCSNAEHRSARRSISHRRRYGDRHASARKGLLGSVIGKRVTDAGSERFAGGLAAATR